MDERMGKARQLITAVREGNFEAVTNLIGSNTWLVSTMTPFGTCLHVAASEGKLDMVKKLVELGCDVNTNGGALDSSPINYAAGGGHLSVVKYLVTAGAKIDTEEPHRNPLFGAIYGGHLAIVKLLIDCGIDIHVKYTGRSMKNMDALAFAKERGQTEIAKFLERA